jgi:hypothetical protein
VPRHELTSEDRKRGNQFTAGEKAVSNGKKGGIAKGQKAKQRKTMAELAAKIGEAPIKSAKTKKQLEELGLAGDDELVGQAVIVASIYTAAANGNMQAVEKWQELTESIKGGDDNAVKVIIDV